MPKLTPTGAAAGVGGVILVIIGAALGYPVLCVVGAAGILACVAGGLLTAVPPRFEVERSVQASRVARGTPVVGVVSVRNVGRRPAGALVALDTLVRNGEVAGALEVSLPAVRPGRRGSATYQLPTDRRGDLRIGPLSLERSDPFGLWVAPRPVGEPAELLVVPRILPMAPRPGGQTRHLEGPKADRAPTGSITFHSLREYVVGDDLRRVHWKTSARTGTLMVREQVDTSLPSTVIVLDARPDRFAIDAFEEAVDLVASLVTSSLDHGFPVRLLATDGHRERAAAPGPSARGVDAFLAGVTRTGTEDLSRLATEVIAGREHDTLMVVTGTPERADLGAVAAMSRRFETVVVATIRESSAEPDAAVTVPAGTLHLDTPTAAAAIRQWTVGGRR